MADNIYEEHLENPTETFSENHPDDFTLTKDTDTFTQN